MAKVSMPLGSGTASGAIGPRLTFSKRASGQQVRFQRAQKDRVTDLRTAQRDKFLVATAMWNGLTAPEKLVYEERAKFLQMTGYNLFVKEALLSPPVPCLITQVCFVSASNVNWTFDYPVSSDTQSDVAFEIQDNYGYWYSPTRIVQLTDLVLQMGFGMSDFDYGQPWRVLSTPTHVDFTHPLEVPQFGFI